MSKRNKISNPSQNGLYRESFEEFAQRRSSLMNDTVLEEQKNETPEDEFSMMDWAAVDNRPGSSDVELHARNRLSAPDSGFEEYPMPRKRKRPLKRNFEQDSQSFERAENDKRPFSELQRRFVPYGEFKTFIEEVQFLGFGTYGCVGKLNFAKTVKAKKKLFQIALKTLKKARTQQQCLKLESFYQYYRDIFMYEVLTQIMDKEFSFVMPIEDFIFSNLSMICTESNVKLYESEPKEWSIFTASPIAPVNMSEVDRVSRWLKTMSNKLYIVVCWLWWLMVAHQKGFYHGDLKVENLYLTFTNAALKKVFTIEDYQDEFYKTSDLPLQVPKPSRIKVKLAKLDVLRLGVESYSPADFKSDVEDSQKFFHIHPWIADFDFSNQQAEQSVIENNVYNVLEKSPLQFTKIVLDCQNRSTNTIVKSLSKSIRENILSSTYLPGTPSYLPPEFGVWVLCSDRSNTRYILQPFVGGIDLWSIGICIAEMFTINSKTNNSYNRREPVLDLYQQFVLAPNDNEKIWVQFMEDLQVYLVEEQSSFEIQNVYQDNSNTQLSAKAWGIVYGLCLSHWVHNQYAKKKEDQLNGNMIFNKIEGLDDLSIYHPFIEFYNVEAGFEIMRDMDFSVFDKYQDIPLEILEILSRLLDPNYLKRTSNYDSSKAIAQILIDHQDWLNAMFESENSFEDDVSTQDEFVFLR